MFRAAAGVLLSACALAGCASAPQFDVAASGVSSGFVTTVSDGRPDALAATDGGWAIKSAAPVEPQVAGWSATVRTHDNATIVVDQVSAEGDGAYHLDTGDKLRVFVYAQPSLSRIYTVDQEGLIAIPLIGDVRARGLTTRSLAGAIKSRLSQTYVRDPHVTVDINQNRPFFILGEVKTSGQFPYVPGMTVDAAVAIAGGYSERANERKVQITRRMNGVIEKLDAARDALVRPGDTIYVTERWF